VDIHVKVSFSQSFGLEALKKRISVKVLRMSVGRIAFSEWASTFFEMESHEVLRDVLKKISAKQIASDMGLSLSLIYKWAEPPAEGSGANNPLDRVEQLIASTGDERFAQWICQRSEGFFIRNPESVKHTGQLMPLTNDIVQDFADMLATIATSSADNVITKEEAKTIRNRWESLKSVTESFVLAAESGNFKAVEAAKERPAE